MTEMQIRVEVGGFFCDGKAWIYVFMKGIRFTSQFSNRAKQKMFSNIQLFLQIITSKYPPTSTNYIFDLLILKVPFKVFHWQISFHRPSNQQCLLLKILGQMIKFINFIEFLLPFIISMPLNLKKKLSNSLKFFVWVMNIK